MKGPPVHPGVVLRDGLQQLDISARDLAASLGVPPNRVYQIIAAKRDISPDTSLRLARYFSTPEDYWINLQTAFDLALTRRQLAKTISGIPQSKSTPLIKKHHPKRKAPPPAVEIITRTAEDRIRSLMDQAALESNSDSQARLRNHAFGAYMLWRDLTDGWRHDTPESLRMLALMDLHRDPGFNR
jgi:antitoxin HigA-1